MLEVLAEDVATGAVGRLITAPVVIAAPQVIEVTAPADDVATRPIDISDIASKPEESSKSDSELF
jgi:hypothetical protein